MGESLDHQRMRRKERIEPHVAANSGQSLLRLAQQHQALAVPPVAIVRIYCKDSLPSRQTRSAITPKHGCIGQNLMAERFVRTEFNGLLGQFKHPLQRFLGLVLLVNRIDPSNGMAGGECGIWTRESGVQLNVSFEQLSRLVELRNGYSGEQAVQQIIAAEEVIIGFPAGRGFCKRPMRLRIVDMHGQPGRNHAGYFILNRKCIAQLPVKSICPQMGPPNSVDQLSGDANRAIAALDTSFEDVTRIEFSADLAN